MTAEKAVKMLTGSYKFAVNYPSFSDEDGDQRLFINVEALGMAIEALKRNSPCDLCRFNPPSSTDEKPCSMCPAVAIEEVEE